MNYTPYHPHYLYLVHDSSLLQLLAAMVHWANFLIVHNLQQILSPSASMIRNIPRIPWRISPSILIRPVYSGTLLGPSIVFNRHKIWTNPLSRFNTKSQNSPEIIQEETNQERVEVVQLLEELRHYSKTREVPGKLRQGILSSKLSQLLTLASSFTTEGVSKTADQAFMQLFYLNNRNVSNMLTSEDLSKFYVRMSKVEGTQFESMAKIAEYYVSEQSETIPEEILLQIISMALNLAGGNLQSTLTYLMTKKKKVFNSRFTESLLNLELEKGRLTILTFEAIIKASENLGTFTLLNDSFYLLYMNYIDSLFDKNPPKPYEYQNIERDIDRTQIFLHEQLLESLHVAQISPATTIKLLQHAWNLQSINPRKDFDKVLVSVKELLSEEGNVTDKIKDAVFKEGLEEESLAQGLLDLLWYGRGTYGSSGTDLCKFIINDDIKFSIQLRLIAKLQLLFDNNELNETIIQDIDQILRDQSLQPEDLIKLYEKIVFLYTTCESSTDSFAQKINQYFREEHAIEPSVLIYKFRLDKEIRPGNHEMAMKIFDESIKNFTQWETESDARALSTLNQLIVLLCTNLSGVDEIFPLFRRIKQQMVSHSINVYAVKALAEKMLDAEYVGDLIEMLKQELPSIKRDDLIKLPTSGPAFVKYRELFDLLHNFVITYNSEETHETNWVLYGELHKYFSVPYDSYLPAMKFFCEHDRSNASLIIFRQLKKLSELHGSMRHLPPLRDMYLYLFKDFGNKLYEEGVHEIHEYLKIDQDIPKQDIELQNCILNAYSNLQDVPKARDLFISMSSVPKQVGGINEETVQIMLKTFTYSDMMYVQKFWNDLSLYGVLPNYAIFKQYIIAHVYHGLVDEAFEVLKEMEDYDIEFSSDLLLAMHNYCLEVPAQEKVKSWAQKNFPDKLESLAEKGLLKPATNYVPNENLIAESNTN